ncbi:MAG: peptidoglycan-binding domain-containing protein [Pseudomonadota bacterium]
MPTLADRIAEIETAFDALKAAAAQDGLPAPDEEELQRVVAEKLAQLRARTQPDPRIKSSLSGAVGNGGRNAPDDAVTVQLLLNTSGAALAPDGLVGPATVRAIASFQTGVLGFGDGRVDPGGQTWQALTGSAPASETVPNAPERGAPSQGASAPGTSGAPGSAGPATPDGPGVAPAIGGAGEGSGRRTYSEVEHPNGVDMDSPTEKAKGWGRSESTPFPADSQVSIGTDFGSLTFEFDKYGNVKGGDITYPLAPGASQGFAVARGIFVVSVGVDVAFAKISVSGTKSALTIKRTVGGKCSATVGLGKAGRNYQDFVMVGIQGEYSGTRDLGSITLDLSNPANLPKLTFGLPVVLMMNATYSGGLYGKAGGLDFSPKFVADYPNQLNLTINPSGPPTLALGPGSAKMSADLEYLWQGLIDKLGDIDEALEEDDAPAKADTGLTDPDGYQDALDQWTRQQEMNAVYNAHAEAESNLSAAYMQAAAPELLSKANTLGQKDPGRAAEIYGSMWQQRSDALAAYDGYVWGRPASDTKDAYNAKTAQAQSIAARLYMAVGLFQAGDAKW